MISLKKLIFALVCALLIVAGYINFKDVNLVKSGDEAGSALGREINKNMNNN